MAKKMSTNLVHTKQKRSAALDTSPKGDKKDLEDFFKKVQGWLVTASKMKRVMQRKKLRAARANCPHCDGGILHATLNGRKDHLHMRCDKCELRFME